jgi:catechol 2,3-dioxygenase-like lactoylglutathione lyase family enzyme
MSPTIRSLVIPVSDLDAAEAVYSALLGQPHTEESYYVGTTSTASRWVSIQQARAGGRWPSPMSRISTRPARSCSRLAPSSATRRVRSHQGPRICVLADPDGNPIGLRGK